MFFLKCFFLTVFHHAKIKGIKRLATVIELRNKNEQNVISYSQIMKIEIISCEQIIVHFILNKLVDISRR